MKTIAIFRGAGFDMSARVDLVVRNGTIVTSSGQLPADLAIEDGRIVGIAAPGRLALAGTEEYDATGQHVLPGVIDGHVHFREPGLEYKEDFGTGSLAAVMGGVTTVIDMPNTLPTVSTPDVVRLKQRLAESKSYCDFALYGLLVDESVEQRA
jgi:dihydroorotase-like cyclic amidohydrolase